MPPCWRVAPVAGSVLVALLIDYRRKCRFYGDLAACVDGVEHPLWVTEMVDEPDHIEAASAYEALRTGLQGGQ